MVGALVFWGGGAKNLAYITQRCFDDTSAGSNPSPSKKQPHHRVGRGGGNHLQSLSRRILESPVSESLAGLVRAPVEHLNCNSHFFRQNCKVVKKNASP